MRRPLGRSWCPAGCGYPTVSGTRAGLATSCAFIRARIIGLSRKIAASDAKMLSAMDRLKTISQLPVVRDGHAAVKPPLSQPALELREVGGAARVELVARHRGALVLEVLGSAGNEHYRVRWDEEHQSILYPGPDAIIRPTKQPS